MSRRRDSEEGFTLIELMVVVLIIAILIAIAIPQFLGARQRAQDSAAKSNLRNGLTAEKTVYTDNQAYDDDCEHEVDQSSLNWNGAISTRPEALTVTTGTIRTADDTACLSETSKSGTVFNLADVGAGTSAGTFYNKGGACTTVAATLAGAWNTGW
jgi:type IV pilus assembly protein PilA